MEDKTLRLPWAQGALYTNRPGKADGARRGWQRMRAGQQSPARGPAHRVRVKQRVKWQTFSPHLAR